MSDDAMERLLERAREMRVDQQRRLAEATAEATVSDGRVKAKMNGHRVLIKVKIAPDLVRVDNAATLEELVRDVVNDVTSQIATIRRERFGIVTEMPSLDVDNFLS